MLTRCASAVDAHAVRRANSKFSFGLERILDGIEAFVHTR